MAGFFILGLVFLVDLASLFSGEDRPQELNSLTVVACLLAATIVMSSATGNKD